jgi:hypothetical protein
VNVQLVGNLKAGEGRMGTQGTILLENPVNHNQLTADDLVEQVKNATFLFTSRACYFNKFLNVYFYWSYLVLLIICMSFAIKK